MDIEKIFDEIYMQTIFINDYWKERKLSSKKIRAEVKKIFFDNKNANFISKFAYFYALDKRIKEKYSNFLKKLFRFFSWKSEATLLKTIKNFLGYPDYFDAKSIIIEKSKDMINDNDYFENYTLKNGLKISNKMQNKTKIKKGKLAKNSSFVKSDSKIIDVEIKNQLQNAKLEDGNLKMKKNQIAQMANDNVFYDDNPKQSNIIITETSSKMVENNQAVREKIEIPKDDLLHTKMPVAKNTDESLKNNIEAKKIKNEQKIDDFLINNADFLEKNQKNENFFNNNHKKQDEEIAYYEQLAVDKSNKNAVEKQSVFVKASDNLNDYYYKNLQNIGVSTNKDYEQQMGKIAGEEISKLSENDVQSIKDFMQEKLNEQMDIAEKNGEVYKMPISIKEVIEPKIVDKSQVQVNEQKNPILKNK